MQRTQPLGSVSSGAGARRLDRHRPAIVQRQPASGDAVDEPEADDAQGQPGDEDADAERDDDEQRAQATHSRPNQNVRICQRKCDSSQVPRASLRFT